MDFFKIGTSEISRECLAKLDLSNNYVCNYSGVWQVFFSNADNIYYGVRIVNYKGFAVRGRYHILTGKEINHILGKKILIEK